MHFKVESATTKIFGILFGFISLSPIFLSFQGGNLFFDRSIIDSPENSSIISTPLSYIVVFIGFLLNFRAVVASKELLFLLLYIAICFILYIIFNDGDNTLSFVKVTVQFFALAFSISVFRIIFINSSKKHMTLDLRERFFVVYPFLLVLAFTVYGYFVFEPGVFLLPNFVIYNWYQYFAFAFLILLAVSFGYNKALGCCVLFATILLSVETNNNTVLVLTYIFLVFLLLDHLFNKPSSNDFLYTIVILGLVFLSVLYIPAAYFYYVNYLPTGTGGLDNRSYMVYYYISSIDWYGVLLPFLVKNINNGWHNQLLVVFQYAGILGIILYYRFFIRSMRYFVYNYRFVKITALLIVFLGGITVLSSMHIYVAVVLGYVIAFYSVQSEYVCFGKNEVVC